MHSNVTYQNVTLSFHTIINDTLMTGDTQREETGGELNRNEEKGFRWMLNSIPADGCRFCRSTITAKYQLTSQVYEEESGWLM